MNDKKLLFEDTPVMKALLTMAIPTIISQLINLIYNLADTFFVGRTGNPYMIAAVSLSFTLFIFTVSIANLFGIGGGGLVSRLMGVNAYDRARRVSAFGFYGALIAAASYSIIIGIFMDPILRLFGASDSTIVFARQYTLIVVVIGSVPIILASTLAHLLRNTGFSKQASMGLSGGGILNMILDPLFMFVLFPKGMEVAGAAIATLISNIASLIYFIIMVNKVSKSAPVSISLKDVLACAPSDRKEVIRVGVPSAILPGLYDVGNVVLHSRMATHGDMQLAAIGIVLKVERLPNAIGIGISQGMLPLVAYNYASGNRQRRDDFIKSTRKLGLIVTMVTTVLYEIFATQIVSVFISSGSSGSDAAVVIGFATSFLRIRALASMLMFLNYHTSYCMQAMGDGKGTLIHSVFRQLIFYIPFLFLFDVLIGENGLAAALIAGEALGAITALILLRNWLKKSEIKEHRLG